MTPRLSRLSGLMLFGLVLGVYLALTTLWHVRIEVRGLPYWLGSTW